MEIGTSAFPKLDSLLNAFGGFVFQRFDGEIFRRVGKAICDLNREGPGSFPQFLSLIGPIVEIFICIILTARNADLRIVRGVGERSLFRCIFFPFGMFDVSLSLKSLARKRRIKRRRRQLSGNRRCRIRGKFNLFHRKMLGCSEFYQNHFSLYDFDVYIRNDCSAPFSSAFPPLFNSITLFPFR